MYPIAHLLSNVLENPTASGGSAQFAERLPRTNILEGDADFRILMDLPGVRNEDLDISLEEDTLTVKAERNAAVPEGYKARRSEMAGKVTFRRSFDLGHGIDAEHISARLEHGILTVTLPKSEKAMPRRIEVK
jgi:HSP20 family protein